MRRWPSSPGTNNQGSEYDSEATVVAYWGIENAETAFHRLLEFGATSHEPVQDVGGGIKVATVKDPFGNIFGIIENPHFRL